MKKSLGYVVENLTETILRGEGNIRVSVVKRKQYLARREKNKEGKSKGNNRSDQNRQNSKSEECQTFKHREDNDKPNKAQINNKEHDCRKNRIEEISHNTTKVTRELGINGYLKHKELHENLSEGCTGVKKVVQKMGNLEVKVKDNEKNIYCILKEARESKENQKVERELQENKGINVIIKGYKKIIKI